jgi:hypothetical protein
MNDINKSREAADSYAELAERLYREGLLKEAEFGFEAAASIDLSDLELQNCWGGAFNGQIARRNLVQEIIRTWKPDAIIETGTFRGVTTEWFAEITLVPIYTCEKNKRFFSQSRQRLAKWPNVHILLQDSREFILQIAGDDISKKKVLFYLDSHWELDLPLREEIKLIFKLFEHPCVIVDDFRVPFDSGYFYDDYGPGKVLSLEILDGLLTPDIQIAFPSTPSELDSGARRGAVLLMRQESSEIIASTNLVRLGGARDWHITNLETAIDIQILQINELTKKISELQYHADERMRQINELTDLIKKNHSSRFPWFKSHY